MGAFQLPTQPPKHYRPTKLIQLVMMRVVGAVALALATLLACCSADLHQDQDVSAGDHHAADYESNGHKPRNLDPLGGGHFVRELRESPHFPFFKGRLYHLPSSPSGTKRDPWPMVSPLTYGYYEKEYPGSNFDEIDRSGLDTFMKKRNFDEIDQTSMPFPFKRFYRLYGPNNLDTPVSSFDKKRYRPDYPMDEIDLSQFPIGSKRSYDFSATHPLR